MAPQDFDEREQELAKKTFRQVEELFHATCRMPAAEREAYFEREGVSEAVRLQVAALFEYDEVQGDAFDEAWLPGSDTTPAASEREQSGSTSVDPGVVLDDFRLEKEIGRGGMAVVYRAQQISLDRTVALKVLSFPLMTEVARQRFRREAAAGGRLHHDNIVTVYHFGQQDDLLFFAMELVEGPTLAEWLVELRSENVSTVPQSSQSAHARHSQICRWIAEAASGLAHAHAHDVIHRDIKPSNLILTPEGRVKILDFGVAKLRGEAGLTTTGAFLGTPRYMSPEQLSPDGQVVDHRADIYSLGATFYELLTLEPPYPGEDFGQVIGSICASDPRPPRQLNRTIPADLEAICLRAMARAPDNRYQNVEELASDLRNWQAGRPISVVLRGPLTRLTRAALLRRNRTAVAMTALLLVCTTLIAWFLLQPKPQQTGPKQINIIGQETLTFMQKSDYALDSTLSGDGRWAAYASDEGSETGDMNIWLRRLPDPGPQESSLKRSEDPIQITFDPRNEIEPTLSPDGRLLAFCTTGVDAKVYLLDLDDEGEPSQRFQVGAGGRGPKFSPDGRWLAWWVGPMSRQLGILGDSIRIASAEVDSREKDKPRSFCPEFVMASYPVWSPDSKHLLFKGVLRPDVAVERNVTSEPDWWVAPIDGSWPAKPLAVMRLLDDAGISWTNLCAPSCWTPRSHQIIFSGFSHSGMKLWSLSFSPTEFATSEPPHLLTPGGRHEFYPESDAGLGKWERCCYTSVDFDYGIWSLPIDADRAVVTDEIARVAQNKAMDMTPSVSTDGRRVVFESLRGGPFDIWLKEEGKDARRVTNGPNEKGYSVISHDGSQVAFAELTNRATADAAIAEGKLQVIDLTKPENPVSAIAKDVGTPEHWYPSTPPQFVLTQRGGQLGLVDTDSGDDAIQIGAVPIVHRDGWWIDSGKFSPDGRWIAFSAAPFSDTRRGRIFVAPFKVGEAVESEDWLPIFDEADEAADGHLPDWSPSGEILYFVSDRDGSRCLWFQRVDPKTKRPLGAPQHLHPFHEYRLSPQFQHWDLLRLSVARNQIVISLADCTGDVYVGWLEER